jgi:hypothetical protein
MMGANWYFAKCDKCCEVKTFFVKNPIYSAGMFEKQSSDIGLWFEKHYGCELTLGWRDDHLDQLWKEGYTNEDLR